MIYYLGLEYVGKNMWQYVLKEENGKDVYRCPPREKTVVVNALLSEAEKQRQLGHIVLVY